MNDKEFKRFLSKEVTKIRNKNYQAQWKEINKEKVKEYSVKVNLKNSYNITIEEYDQMLQKQNYVCAICKRPERRKEARTDAIRRLAVDHCHKTNKVRGLLCSDCNTAIGLFQDDVNILQEAIEYLQQ